MSRTEFDARAYATAVARYGLDGAEPPAAVGDESWSLALATLAEEKILGIAAAAATEGWLPLTDEQYENLLNRHRNAMVWCLALERRLLQIADAFEAEGIESIVLKGPAIAHTVYPDPTWRTFSDLDVLVRTRQWRAACRVLQGEFGWPRRLPEPRPGFDERFGKSAVFATESGQQIDLHRTLAQGPFGIWVSPDDLFSRRGEFSLADRTLSRLNDTGLFIHACIHAMLGDPQPTRQQLRDVQATIAHGMLDEELLQEWIQGWRLAAVVHRSLSSAAACGYDSVPPELLWLRRSRISNSDGRLIEAHANSGRHRLPMATLRAIRGFRNQAAYLAARAFPSAAFLRARGMRSGSVSRFLRIVNYVLSLRNRTHLPAGGFVSTVIFQHGDDTRRVR
jgi:hypothetical protein